MSAITKSRRKIEDWTRSRARDRRAAELMRRGMENQAAYKQAFDEEDECSRVGTNSGIMNPWIGSGVDL